MNASISERHVPRVHIQHVNPVALQGSQNCLNLWPARAELLSFIQLAQMGPDFLFVESPTDHPPARATIELRVDDAQRTWEVDLPQGMKAGDERVVLGAIG